MGPIGGDLYQMPLERKAQELSFRQPLQTGIKGS
jgi:hypothetical protein